MTMLTTIGNPDGLVVVLACWATAAFSSAPKSVVLPLGPLTAALLSSQIAVGWASAPRAAVANAGLAVSMAWAKDSTCPCHTGSLNWMAPAQGLVTWAGGAARVIGGLATASAVATSMNEAATANRRPIRVCTEPILSLRRASGHSPTMRRGGALSSWWTASGHNNARVVRLCLAAHPWGPPPE